MASSSAGSNEPATRATLKFAERTPSGWSPATAAAAGDDWFVNWADVPSVLRLDDGTLAAHWLQKSGAETYAYDVRLAHSKDDGRTWSASFTPHHDGTKREHGFASLFQMPGAGLGLIWLDGRAMGSAEGHDAHGTNEGAMSVRYGTFDGAWKQTSEMPVDLRVCECCPTTAAMTSEGPIAAYRNRTDDEIRDIYVSRMENGKWTDGKPVHDDQWKIAACPVNGPMLSARGPRRRSGLVHGQGRCGPRIRRVLATPVARSAHRFAWTTRARSGELMSLCCQTGRRWPRGSSSPIRSRRSRCAAWNRPAAPRR